MTGAPAAARAGRVSIGDRVNSLLFLGLGLQVLLIVCAGVTAAISARDTVRAVADHGNEVAAAGLQAAMADEQSGLLAYVDSAQPDALVLYAQGRAETNSSLRLLQGGTAGTADAGAEALVESAVRSWETWAERMRERVAAAGSPVTDPTAGIEGRRLFATFRQRALDLVAYFAADSAAGERAAFLSTLSKVAAALAGGAAVGLLMWLTARRVLRHGLEPLRALGRAAEQVAIEGRAAIPHRDRPDEVGELARALQGWQEAAIVRTILVEQAPVGICRIDVDGRFLTTNAAFEAMLGYGRQELAGKAFWNFLHADDQVRARDGYRSLVNGSLDHTQSEMRWLCRSGGIAWFSMVAAPVPGLDGRPETLIGIMEDINERKLQAQRAGKIQRHLLPQVTPLLDGYDLAGACVAAEDVGGDLYDWVGPTSEGAFDLTVADVMGRGAGAALIMATLRAALRTAPAALGPASRVQRVAESMTEGRVDEGVLATLLHARLDLGSGLLRYVDAGHGNCLVRTANGRALRLETRSHALGPPGPSCLEGRVVLRPGDTLLVHTDGLVDVGDRRPSAAELAAVMGECADAAETVARLLERVRGKQADDATVVVLRRDPAPAGRRRTLT